MEFMYKLSEAEQRFIDMMNGLDPKPIRLYPVREHMVEDFNKNELSDWWYVSKERLVTSNDKRNWHYERFTDFDSKEDALEQYYSEEQKDWYETIHDC